MKFFSIRNILILVCLLLALLAYSPRANAGDDVTVSAVATWITKHTKNSVQRPQAMKIADTVFHGVKAHRIDPYLVVAMISAESMFNTRAGSSVGAKGLMQVMPRWHKDKIRGRNIYDINTNIEVGLQILQDCLVKAKDRMTSSLRCYSGGASGKYEKRIIAAHNSLKQAVLQARFEQEKPIIATATYSKPRYWHDQMDYFAAAERRRFNDTNKNGEAYESLIASLGKPKLPPGFKLSLR